MQGDKTPPNERKDVDQTVFVPRPGGRRRGGAAAESATQPVADGFGDAGAALPEGVGANPLLRASASLFVLVRQLKAVRQHHDVPGLRREVTEAIHLFDSEARRAGVDTKTTAQAAYALCALIDETVLGTPWGLESVWAKQSLLIIFYKEYTAGETFFNFIKKAKETPKEYMDLLEFYFVCISLGFQGRFRVESGGVNELARIKDDLFNIIVRERGRPDPELSVRWRGVSDKAPAVSRVIPLWTVAVATLGLLLLGYAFFTYRLNAASDVTYAKIAGLAPVAARSAPVSIPTVIETNPQQMSQRLRVTLDAEIRARQPDVEDVGHATRIVLYNRGMFASGGANGEAQFQPLIRKIALFLADQNAAGPFVVTGHTDNVPIRSLRFPSNHDLSRARADAVADVLVASGIDRAKLRINGVADSEPIASNATADGRAKNRRVEILFSLTQAQEAAQ
ncbi:MAG: type VI secretion system protein TssL [Rhodospirillales bacterium]|nr:type VI secretion system protein TssL [Rhodospirillales bacterium]